MTDAEIESLDLIPPGTYDFEVLAALDKVSQKGNDMIELKINVFGPDGRQKHVYDYLVASDHGLCIRKIKHFASSVGLTDQYEAGVLDATNLEGKTGKVLIVIEDDPTYGRQNKVSDYATAADYVSSKATKSRKKAPPMKGQDIPF